MKPQSPAFLVTFTILSLAGATNGLAQMPSMPPQPNLGKQKVASEVSISPTREIIPAGDMSLPPMGEPGKCYARVWEPPVYGTLSKKS